MSEKFFFKKGYASQDLIKGEEKNGKWFAGAKFRNRQFPLSLDHSELGNWLNYFQICVNLSRGVKKMHQMGLSHSDLSYNNVLVDPQTGSACMIDLDGFKAVNDQLGHSAGDDVLVKFAQVLKQSSRSSDILARMGGDEFVVILLDTDQAGAEEYSVRAITMPLFVNELDAAVSQYSS